MMSHTHDRTLLASLGFQDPDKKDRRHTLACQYLCQPEVATRLWGRLVPSLAEPTSVIEDVICEGPGEDAQDGRRKKDEPRFRSGPRAVVHTDAMIEVPVTKDRGFLVGFVDVVARARASEGCFDETAERDSSQGWPANVIRRRYTARWHNVKITMRIEVKARPVDVADIARQIATYAGCTVGSGYDYDLPPLWVVATCYKMPAADKATLAAKGIYHVWLGEGFAAYCKAREADVLDDDAGL